MWYYFLGVIQYIQTLEYFLCGIISRASSTAYFSHDIQYTQSLAVFLVWYYFSHYYFLCVILFFTCHYFLRIIILVRYPPLRIIISSLRYFLHVLLFLVWYYFSYIIQYTRLLAVFLSCHPVYSQKCAYFSGGIIYRALLFFTHHCFSHIIQFIVKICILMVSIIWRAKSSDAHISTIYGLAVFLVCYLVYSQKYAPRLNT